MRGKQRDAQVSFTQMSVYTHTRDFLRLNVGFIIHQSVGYHRDFSLDIPFIHLPPDLNLDSLSGTVRVTRTGQGLLVQVKMSARTACECVRCLTDFQQPLEIDFSELYAFRADAVTDSGLVVPEDGRINLTPLIREEMLLSIPISPICKPDCKGLCPICGENLNETTCNHEDEVIDPRLAVLKSLLDKRE